MSKPTPGPCCIVQSNDQTFRGVSLVSEHDGATIAHFFGKTEQAEANASAWVDGMAAMETIQKIRAFEREFSESRMNAYQAMIAIAGILDEAKP